MAKKKSRRETKHMKQTALWLPHDMLAKLRSAGGERGLGDEIRRRLQVTFGDEQRSIDPLTDLLLNLIKQIALELSLDAPWSANRFAFDVFKAAISELLDLISNVHPRSDVQASTMSKLQAKYGSNEKPETIGRMLARSVLVENANEQLRLRFADNRKG